MVNNWFHQFIIVRILLLQIISRLDLTTNGDRRIKWKFSNPILNLKICLMPFGSWIPNTAFLGGRISEKF